MLDATAYLGHVNANRFLLLDIRNQEQRASDAALADLASKLCSAGHIDDLLVLSPSLRADARYRIIGGDRREAEFCGNGALFAFSVLAKGKGRVRLTLETKSGHCAGDIAGHELRLRLGPVEEGRFAAKPWVMPYLREKKVTYIGVKNAGEPHLIVSAPSYLMQERFDQYEFEDVCAPLRDGFKVEGGINVTMTFPPFGEAQAMVRTFERGAQRMTYSCGSGALAAACALFSHIPAERKLRIASPGGTHLVWSESARGPWWLAAVAHHERSGALRTLLDFMQEKVS